MVTMQKNNLKKKNIRLLILDVDGTLTDGKIYMGVDGELLKAFHIKDGYAIHDMLPPSGIKPIILTGRASRIVVNRCKELGISMLFQGVHDKLSKLDEILMDQIRETGENYTVENLAYMGDDLNDLACMRRIAEGGGIIGCPADAVEPVRQLSDFVSTKKGGEGAVREFIEWLLS